MSLATKTVLVILFFATLVGLISLLPSATCTTGSVTGCYPLPSQFATSLFVVLSYVFAWSNVFWFINAWFQILLLQIGFDITVWIAKKVIWIIGWLARLAA